MEALEEMLKKEDIMHIKDYIEECQTDYYIGEEESVYKDFMYGIDEYDKLVTALELDEGTNMIVNEMVDRKSFMDVISIFKTGFYDLYFVRMEQYGYADDDAVVYRLAFTKDTKKLLDDCKSFAAEHDFIKDRNDLIGKKTVGNGHISGYTKNNQ
jgi:hypothetical protein